MMATVERAGDRLLSVFVFAADDVFRVPEPLVACGARVRASLAMITTFGMIPAGGQHPGTLKERGERARTEGQKDILAGLLRVESPRAAGVWAHPWVHWLGGRRKGAGRVLYVLLDLLLRNVDLLWLLRGIVVVVVAVVDEL